MRRHPLHRLVATLTLATCALLVGCGGSDDSSGSAGDPGGSGDGAAAAPAPAGGDDAEASPDDEAAEASPGEPRDLPGSGLSFQEALNQDGLSTEQISELSITLSVLGIDRAGYVSGSTIVAQTTDDDPEDRQFSCIAADQVTQDLYEVVVVDEAGEVLDC